MLFRSKTHIQQVRRAGKDAISFFYYSGHGASDPETHINYLIPVDVDGADDANLWTNSFELNDIVNKMREQDLLRTIPIVAVTAFAMKGDEEKIRDGGCEAYIAKPISVVQFLETVDRFLQ